MREGATRTPIKETLRRSTIKLASDSYTSLLHEVDLEIAEKAAAIVPGPGRAGKPRRPSYRRVGVRFIAFLGRPGFIQQPCFSNGLDQYPSGWQAGMAVTDHAFSSCEAFIGYVSYSETGGRMGKRSPRSAQQCGCR